MSTAPSALRVEHLDDPLGHQDDRHPRLSWRLPDGAQATARLPADGRQRLGHGLGRRPTRSLLVAYAGPPPASSAAGRVAGAGAHRPRREPGVAAGLVRDRAAVGRGLAGLVDRAGRDARRRTRRAAGGAAAGGVRRRSPGGARRGCTRRRRALYEVFVNGRRVGDAELTPGFTQYDARLQVQTYDVTDDGRGRAATRSRWCSPTAGSAARPGITRSGRPVGRPAGAARPAAPGPRRRRRDRRRHGAGLAQLGRSRRGGRPHRRRAVGPAPAATRLGQQPVSTTRAGTCVATVEHGFAGLVDSPAPPVRRVEEIVPVSVTRLADGRQVVDLGQNINGWVRLTDLGPAGTTTTLTHGEHLDAGRRRHHRPPATGPAVPARARCPPGQVDQVVSAGVPGDVFEPRHTTHGFHYVRVEGHPGAARRRRRARRGRAHRPAAHRLVLLQRRADQPAARGRRLEPPRQRLRHPHRLPAPRARRLDRRLAAVRPDRRLPLRRGRLLDQVAARRRRRPVARRHDRQHEPRRRAARAATARSPFLNGSAGWGDAAVIVPWELYRAYGDIQVLEELWPTMVRWLDRAERDRPRRSGTRAGSTRRPEPAAHEEYLWDSGFHWGEWLVPGDDTAGDLGDRSPPPTRATSPPRTSPAAPADGPDRRGARPRRRRGAGTPS